LATSARGNTSAGVAGRRNTPSAERNARLGGASENELAGCD
jgi:hypothetical protein